MEKVKVSQDIANAIEWSIIWHKQNRPDLKTQREIHAELIHLSTTEAFQWEYEEILNTVATYDLAEMLIKGYEVEQTPEEKIAKHYSKLKRLCEPLSENSLQHKKYVGTMEGIQYVLYVLNIKVPGVNA